MHDTRLQQGHQAVAFIIFKQAQRISSRQLLGDNRFNTRL